MADKQEQPLSDEQFWENYARDIANKSVSQIEDSGSKIQTAVGWFWTIYTAGAIVGTSLFKPSFPWYINILIALPILLLFLAYYFALRVQVPITRHFDPDNTDSIINFHNSILSAKEREKGRALITLFASSIVIFMAIILSVTYQPGKSINIQTSQLITDNNTVIAFTGHFPLKTQVQVIVESLKDPSVPVIEKVVTDTSSSTGDLYLSIPINNILTSYSITAEWKGVDGLTYSVKKTVRP